MEHIELLREAEAARALGVTRRCLQSWRAARRGPAFIRVGSRLVRYARSDLMAFAAAHRVTTRETAADASERGVVHA